MSNKTSKKRKNSLKEIKFSREQENHLIRVEKEVNSIPAKMEKELAKAVKETTERITADFSKNEEILKKEIEGEKNVFKTKIQTLEKTVTDQAKQISSLSSQLERVYGNVQNLAVKAIEGFSPKILPVMESEKDKNKADGADE